MSYSRLTRSAGLVLVGCLATASFAIAQSVPSPAPQVQPTPPAATAPATAAPSAAPAAAPAGPGDAALGQRKAGPMRACRKDVRALCSDTAVAGKGSRGARLDCLVANRDKVSADCAAAITEIEGRMLGRRAGVAPAAGTAGEAGSPIEGRQAASPAVKEARRAMRQACRGDVENLCKDVPREKGGLRKCLTDNSAKLSAPCSDALAQLPGRRARGG
jgi:hypothetical protein